MKTLLNKALKTSLTIFFFIAFVQITSAQTVTETQTETQEVATIPFEQQNIYIKFLDENGNETKFMMTTDEYKKIEDKVRAYEKQNGITDRTNKIYSINSINYEIVSVTELIK